MSESKAFEKLELEECTYKINENRLPLDSYLKYPPYTHATFMPYVVSGDAGFAEHRQLNWTNKLLWNKFGKLSTRDKEVLLKPDHIISNKEKDILSEEAKRIINEKLEDRKKYIQELDQSLDYKLWKQQKENEEMKKDLLKQIEELKKEVQSLKRQSQGPITPSNTYTINMISEFEKYLTWERLENFKIHERNSQQKISTILDNTYSINNNLEMIYKEVKKPDPPRHYETIIETPAYERFVQRQKQKVYEDELKAKKNAEYEEFIEWKKQQQLKKGKMKETKDIPSFLREEEPVQIKEDTTSQLLEMMKEIRKELDEIKEKQRQKEEEK
ncbi:golgin subfamily A member 6-like protein 22 [Capsicum annuum]|uniref:golgin subfamily A member 6-like protein 22 n=1 Tax=Capsicum annuum TaxID=4072 RepID=UPI001FB0CBB9|nr:golgin subfamily A member 6-like protein 22 [Capsicum annuum]